MTDWQPFLIGSSQTASPVRQIVDGATERWFFLVPLIVAAGLLSPMFFRALSALAFTATAAVKRGHRPSVLTSNRAADARNQKHCRQRHEQSDHRQTGRARDAAHVLRWPLRRWRYLLHRYPPLSVPIKLAISRHPRRRWRVRTHGLAPPHHAVTAASTNTAAMARHP
jgi:hypothetical protein